jgi:LacI family transcriptional regulator
MPVTIHDIARLAGVSKATVSSVLNNRPGIAQETRDKILATVKKLNYRPNQLARSLSMSKSKSIGLIIKEIDNPFFAKIMKGIFEICNQLDYTVLLGSSELSPIKELQSIQTLINQQVAGLIISPLQGEDVDFSYLSDLKRENRSCVMLSHVKNYQTNVVDIDNVQAARDAVLYLMDKGHNRIAYFSGPSHSIHAEERLEGFQQAFLMKHLPVRQDDIRHVGSYIENGFQEGIKLFSATGDFPSAVLCYNDLVAIGLINALQELHIAVPEEVSVVGFDNIEFCRVMKVPLTTVSIPAYQIGQTAAQLLIDQINNPTPLHSEKIVIPTQLVERASVARKT